MISRRKYTKEFIVDAIGLVTQHGYKIAEAAKSLGIKPYLLGRWMKESEEAESVPFRGKGKLTAKRIIPFNKKRGPQLKGYFTI
jgi:transposase-like protein